MIQRMVDAVSDQLEDCLSLIHHFQKPTEAHTGTELYILALHCAYNACTVMAIFIH